MQIKRRVVVSKANKQSTRTKNSGLFASLHFSPLFLACYLGVEAVELLFLKKISPFYGFQMHYLMLLKRLELI
jgi:hypothetical protein